MYSKSCATYETASLRQFQLGRTDTIRSCSIESLEFSKGMMDPSLSKQKKAELLRKAVTGHKNYVAEVSSVSSLTINFRWKYVPFKQCIKSLCYEQYLQSLTLWNLLSKFMAYTERNFTALSFFFCVNLQNLSDEVFWWYTDQKHQLFYL